METMAYFHEAMAWARWTRQRRVRALERTVPYGIQTQQKSAEPAESPSALAATICHHTPFTVPDTPRECRPGRHDDHRRTPATDSSALRGRGWRATACPLR